MGQYTALSSLPARTQALRLCLLFLGELLSHLRCTPRLQFCGLVFCLIFAQVFSISIKALHTPFCTLFPVGVPQFAHPPVIPEHPARLH